MTNNNSQYERQLKDKERYPNDVYSGLYRGIPWRLKRPNGSYWCGYVDLEKSDEEKLSKTDWSNLNDIAHGGLTCGIGFDCAHIGDYYYFPCAAALTPLPQLNLNATFKTYEFAFGEVIKLIDYIVDVITPWGCWERDNHHLFD